jgi:hypothetical protein
MLADQSGDRAISVPNPSPIDLHDWSQFTHCSGGEHLIGSVKFDQ